MGFFSQRMRHKICPVCERSKPLSLYHKDKQNRDGYSNRCAQCRNAARQEADDRKKKKIWKIKVTPDSQAFYNPKHEDVARAFNKKYGEMGTEHIPIQAPEEVARERTENFIKTNEIAAFRKMNAIQEEFDLVDTLMTKQPPKDLLQAVTDKYDHFLTLTWRRGETARLQIFTEPPITFKGGTPEEALQKCL